MTHLDFILHKKTVLQNNLITIINNKVPYTKICDQLDKCSLGWMKKKKKKSDSRMGLNE